MARLLIISTHGSENPTQAGLAFLSVAVALIGWLVYAIFGLIFWMIAGRPG